MKPLLFKTYSTIETKKLARRFKNKRLIALRGDLGTGKTTFIQGFAAALGIKKRLTSPTFIIIRRYKNMYHIDCYRLKKPKEIIALGFKKIIANPQNKVLIEWADKIKKLLPKNTLWLEFKQGSQKNERIIKICEKPSSY